MMKMKIPRTHIPEKILRFRNKRIPEAVLLKQIREIFEEEDLKEEKILQNIQADSEDFESNDFNFDLLETEKIYHLADIERMCIDYRLRFLNTNIFKGDLPYEAVSKIKDLEKAHQTELKGFKIMAPAKLFKLKNADDPLLFAPMGNEYYYLIHSWGKDLHPFRKLIMWPFRHFENFIVFLLVVSLFFTFLVPEGLFSKEPTTSEFIMVYFFMFKWMAGLAIFYGFKMGKNFSSAIWRSKFYNA